MQTGAKLLIVDDDEMIRAYSERMVISLGYSCVFAQNVATALLRLEDVLDIQGLIVDLRLGKGLNGAQLAKQALTLRPELGILLTSGDPVALQIAQQDMPECVAILRKPYRQSELAASLARL